MTCNLKADVICLSGFATLKLKMPPAALTEAKLLKSLINRFL